MTGSKSWFQEKGSLRDTMKNLTPQQDHTQDDQV